MKRPNDFYGYLKLEGFMYLRFHKYFIIMGALELREKWVQTIGTVDERFLRMVDALYEGYFKNETVAFYPDGSPMSREEYKMALSTAEKQIEKGDYISVEEFEKEQ